MLLDNYQQPLQQIFNNLSGSLKENTVIASDSEESLSNIQDSSLATQVQNDEAFSGSLKENTVILSDSEESLSNIQDSSPATQVQNDDNRPTHSGSGSLKKDSVIASEQRERGNLPTTENKPNLSGSLKVPNPKIFYNEIGTSIEFCLDTNGFYCNNKCYFITLKNPNLSTMLYFLGVLNSSTLQYLFQLKFNFGGGKGVDTFGNIQIPQITPQNETIIKHIVQRVEQIINNTDEIQKNTISQQIDQMVYQLYGLTDEEIKMIEQA